MDTIISSGHYRVFGRTVHFNYLKEQLQSKRVNFDSSRLVTLPELSVEVQADTVYIQVCLRTSNYSQSREAWVAQWWEHSSLRGGFRVFLRRGCTTNE